MENNAQPKCSTREESIGKFRNLNIGNVNKSWSCQTHNGSHSLKQKTNLLKSKRMDGFHTRLQSSQSKSARYLAVQVAGQRQTATRRSKPHFSRGVTENKYLDVGKNLWINVVSSKFSACLSVVPWTIVANAEGIQHGKGFSACLSCKQSSRHNPLNLWVIAELFHNRISELPSHFMQSKQALYLIVRTLLFMSA